MAGPSVPHGAGSTGSAIHHSILVIVAAAVTALLARALAAHPARSSASKGRGQGEVDVLLAVEAHQEGGDVADLLPDADVALADERARVVNGLGQAQLEDLGLQPALHDLRRRQPQDVVEL